MDTLFPAGTFRPAPARASKMAMVTAQGKIEALLFLRHGEQLLLSFVIPLGVLLSIGLLPLINDDDPLRKGFPLMLAVAGMSSGFTGQAISLAFDRRYGALKRTGASGVPAWTIITGKVAGVICVSVLQLLTLSITAFALGWRSSIPGFFLGVLVFFLGVACFTALGMTVGGTLSSEIVLGLGNLIWVMLVAVASVMLFHPPADPSPLFQLIPSVSFTQGIVLAHAHVFPGTQILILLGWCVAGIFAASKWFRFT